MSAGAFAAQLKATGKRAGINVRIAHPYALRHAAGYSLASANVPTFKLQSHLGHTKVENTRIYIEGAVRRLGRCPASAEGVVAHERESHHSILRGCVAHAKREGDTVHATIFRCVNDGAAVKIARLSGKAILTSFSKKSAFPSRGGQHRHPHSPRLRS
jgi:Phage integrase family